MQVERHKLFDMLNPAGSLCGVRIICAGIVQDELMSFIEHALSICSDSIPGEVSTTETIICGTEGAGTAGFF